MDNLHTNINNLVLRVIFPITLILLCLFLGPNINGAVTKPHTENLMGPGSLTDEELQDAMKTYLGIRYIYGGASKRGFDCSGFVMKIYDEYFSIDLPHKSSLQSVSPQLMTVPLDDLRTGDLIFFSINNKKNAVNHVGIYLSDGKFIHSGRSTGVVIASLKTSYWRSKIVRAKRAADKNEFKPGTIFMDMDLVFDIENSDFFAMEKTELQSLPLPVFDGYPDHNDIRNSFRSFELGYTEEIGSGLVSSLSFFRRSLMADDPDTTFSTAENYYEPERVKPASVHGLKLTGRFNILDGFSFIPSLTYMDYGQDTDIDNLPRLALDLKYGLFSSTDKWSLTGGIHMPVQRYESSLAWEDIRSNRIGLSLTYQQQISDNMFLMFRGKNFGENLRGYDASPFSFNRKNENLSFIFKIIY